MIRLTIKRKLPSQNDWSNKRGVGAKFAYTKERNVWMALLRSVLTPQAPPTGHVRAEICSYRTHLLDYGNLVGGAKPIPDCLKALGYIRDDRPSLFTCTYTQVRCKPSEVRTTITLETT